MFLNLGWNVSYRSFLQYLVLSHQRRKSLSCVILFFAVEFLRFPPLVLVSHCTKSANDDMLSIERLISLCQPCICLLRFLYCLMIVSVQERIVFSPSIKSKIACSTVISSLFLAFSFLFLYCLPRA